jgi:two-component system response regulator GlrR
MRICCVCSACVWRQRYLVDKAASAEAALSALAVRRADVLLTDWRLPGLDGMELFELVKKSYPSMPVIMLTAHGTVPDAVDAVSRGCLAIW